MTGRIVAVIGLAAVTALAAVWASAGSSQATTFNPFFGPPDFYRLDPTTPGSNADVHAQFNVLPPSANFSPHFGGSITLEDADVSIANDAAIPNGAYVGQLEAVASLGLANEGCNNEVPVTFNLVEANTGTSARPVTPDVTLTSGIAASATSFAYTSSGDPIGPSDSNPTHTRAEIEIDSEQMLVTSINEGTNTYSSVSRGWNGTTPADHNAGAQIRKVNVIFPAGPSSNLLGNNGEDDGDLDNNGTAEFPEFAGNGVPDGADAVPSYVRDSLDPNNDPDDGGYVQAHARYVGVAFVANTLVVILQFVIMDPGALTVFPNLDWATAAWGWSSITFLQDPFAPPSNSAINDFCNFRANTLLYGTTHDNACTGASPPVACTGTGAGFTLRLAVDGGCPGFTTPNECGFARLTVSSIAERLRFYQYTVSQRDYDNDGIENGFDPCPTAANPGWNPREFNSVTGGDSDADGLPDECDPSPGVFNNDQDGDGWQNRIDNCPTTDNDDPGGGGGTIPNTFQYDRDVAPGQHVSDGGPPSDDIGAACDPQSTIANGHYHAAYATSTVCIGAATTDCSFTTDSDGDGVVNATDTCINGANAPNTFTGPFSQDTLAAPANAGDSTIILGSSSGFTVGSPIVIGSPLETLRYITGQAGNAVNITPALSSNHAAGAPVAQVAFAQGMRDMNNDGFVDTADIGLLTGVFGGGGGSGSAVSLPSQVQYQARYDINDGIPNNFIDTGDISRLTGIFGAACGPP